MVRGTYLSLRRVVACRDRCCWRARATRAGRNWLGNKLDATKRSQVMFIDRDDILKLFVVANLPLPSGAIPDNDPIETDLPF